MKRRHRRVQIMVGAVLGVLGSGMAGGCAKCPHVRSVPPRPTEIDCAAYEARVGNLFAEGRLKLEGRSCSIAGVRRAEGGAYIDVVYVGDDQDSYHPRDDLAEFIVSRDDQEHIVLEWSPGERIELLPRFQRVTNWMFFRGTVFLAGPPYFVCENDDDLPYIIQVLPLRTKGPALVPGTYRVRLTEKYNPYPRDEGPTYVDHGWVEVTVN